MTVSSLGIGTGVDLQTMLTKIIAAERAPITALDSRITTANSKISLFGTLKSKLDALQSAADTLQFPSRLSAISANSSDATVLNASAIYTASIGSYSADVTQLASAQKSFSAAYAAGTSFAAGDLNFTVGGVAAPPIKLDGQTSYTLQELGNKINAAKIGVTATVITTATGEQRMVLTGEKSGAGNSFQLTSTLTPSGGQPGLDSFDTTTAGLLRANAQDAMMTLDGIELSSSTNTFSSVSGLTLTAVKVGTANVTVQNDNTKITTAVQAFVDSYNAVASLIKSNSGYNAATKTGQPFSGDSSTRSVLESLYNARTTTPPELASASFKSLSELGVSIQQSGQLSLDTSKLNQAISSSPSEVVKTLNAYGKSFSSAVSDMLGSNGVISNRVSSLNSSVTRFKDSQAALEVRVALIEKRYRAQFTALDKLVNTLKTTSDSLAQQLAALSA